MIVVYLSDGFHFTIVCL